MADIGALEETLAAVELARVEHRWIQGDWWSAVDWDGNWCRTAGCFAGQRAFADGYQLDAANRHRLVKEGADPLYREDIQEWAQRRLDLTRDEAETLFAGSNTILDLRRIVEELVGRPRADA
jgi:hypothetical protein